MMHMHHDSLSIDGMACACNALRKAARAMTRFYDEVMEGSALSLTQFAVLRNIARHEPVPLMDLAHVLVMDRTTLYRTLKPLEREGWIAVAEGKGRAKQARLTAQGRDAVANSQGAWEEAQRRMIGAFGPERWAGVEAALGDLVTLAQGSQA
ncbi:DNA-binding MarR family transcriptional regulator [Novosphingobium sp. 1529]|uniref:MarR family winged helix-turn-helix transcriptional regulator n=1 Tax=Novosphingobium sp. 1529 TaxID=3156424 RepID=UPI00339402E7